MKRQKKYASLLILCSSFLLSSCGGLEVVVCISNPEAGTFECSPPSGEPYSMPFADTENYVCLSPSDARTVIEKAKRCEKK